MNPKTAHLCTCPAIEVKGEPWLPPLPASVDQFCPSTRLPVHQSLAWAAANTYLASVTLAGLPLHTSSCT